jgi:hypothetical protein
MESGAERGEGVLEADGGGEADLVARRVPNREGF